jgi:hypothetical protein
MYAVTMEIKAAGKRMIEITANHFINILAAGLLIDCSSSDRNCHVYRNRFNGSKYYNWRRKSLIMILRRPK